MFSQWYSYDSVVKYYKKAKNTFPLLFGTYGFSSGTNAVDHWHLQGLKFEPAPHQNWKRDEILMNLQGLSKTLQLEKESSDWAGRVRWFTKIECRVQSLRQGDFKWSEPDPGSEEQRNTPQYPQWLFNTPQALDI